jgi:hypothetical protein
MFEKFWDKRRKENPGEPKYISLCYILEGSGETLGVIQTIFESFLDEGIDYDSGEELEMVDYLFTIAKDQQ